MQLDFAAGFDILETRIFEECDFMRIYDLIAKKRDGGTHTREEL